MAQSGQLNQNTNTAFTKEDAYKVLGIINTWISNMDTKVSFSLTLTGVLIGVIFTKGIPNALKTVSEVSKLSELNGGEIIAAILVCILYLVSFFSILFFMLAIIARVRNLNNPQSVFFFGSIVGMNLLDYKAKMNGMNEQDLIEDLENQIHINSMICSKKAKYYNIGVKFLIATIVLWFICMAFRLI